ncbi:MAS protein, partial [Steatornis caripensis]|nr:MAS protein [Steatornis caripensis]
EPVTTDLSLSYMTDGHAHSEALSQYYCMLTDSRLLIISGVTIGVCLCGLVGNGIVLWFLSFQMKKSPFTIYILNLAIADFSLLLILLVAFTLYIISRVYCIYTMPIQFTIYILVALFVFSYVASMYLLSAMSTERCLSVL